MKKILFVCLGNICRSSTAEAIFKSKLKTQGLDKEFEVDSAGLANYHQGELSDPRMRKHAWERGYKLESISRQITMNDLEYFDYILAMDHQNIKGLLSLSEGSRKKINLLAKYCKKHDTDIIPDPYYGNSDGFELVIDLLEDACENLIQELKN